MIKRLIIALALGTGILFTANAQNSAVKDSLLRIYVTAPHDSMRLDVLHDIARLDQQTPVVVSRKKNKLIYFNVSKSWMRTHKEADSDCLSAS